MITIETTADFVGCSDCGVRAESHDRRPIAIIPRPVLLRAAGEVGVDQAAVALPETACDVSKLANDDVIEQHLKPGLFSSSHGEANPARPKRVAIFHLRQPSAIYEQAQYRRALRIAL